MTKTRKVTKNTACYIIPLHKGEKGEKGENMLLKDYLKKTGMKPYILAEKAGICREALYRKNRRMSVVSAEKIEIATHGQVSRMEALWPEYYEEKNIDESEQFKFRFE